jgi:hypothetical protein
MIGRFVVPIDMGITGLDKIYPYQVAELVSTVISFLLVLDFFGIRL